MYQKYLEYNVDGATLLFLPNKKNISLDNSV